MINFSKRGTIDELLKAVSEIPDKTGTVAAPLATAVKMLAAEELGELSKLNADTTNKVNGANLNIRANCVGLFRQVEIQISGFYQQPAPAPTVPTETK